MSVVHVVDDWMYQECYGEREPDPERWDVITCYPWDIPYDIEQAAEIAVEHCCYDGADHPSCGYVDVWIKQMTEPVQVTLFRVQLDFDVTFSASPMRHHVD